MVKLFFIYFTLCYFSANRKILFPDVIVYGIIDSKKTMNIFEKKIKHELKQKHAENNLIQNYWNNSLRFRAFNYFCIFFSG